jgi:hypothetical protein
VYRAGAALTIGASQTNEIEITGGSVSLHGSIEVGAASVTMSWADADGSSEWAIVAIPLNQSTSTQGPRSMHQYRLRRVA